MSNETNEILTIAGKKVAVRYSNNTKDCCCRCPFSSDDEVCTALDEQYVIPCRKYDKDGKYAYFVPAEESEPKNWPADKDNLVGKQAGGSVDRWVVTNAFLHCEKAGKVVSEMYGDRLNNPRNRDKYLAFLQQVNLDDRFGELAEILQRYGAMPAPKEQPVSDLEAEIDREIQKLHTAPCYDELRNFACHFAEWGVKRFREQIAAELAKFKWGPMKHLKK